MKFILEVIGFSIEACVTAQSAGANRIELCDNPYEGGTTPSYGFIKTARQKLHILLYPMIRPRGGDFIYNDDEFNIMKTDINICKNLGCDGVVIGVLTSNGKVDKKRCSSLVECAYPLGVTFHRAFDRTVDPFEALEDIIEIGCERILTSGQRPTASEGASLIRDLVEKADERIIIMPGSGVKADNVANLAESTNAVEFHTAARKILDSKMDYKKPEMNESLELISVDGDEVKKIVKQLSHLKSV
ncbi:MAG: copper homeostasis protein CutC [Ginsengibacter sp.]